MKTFTFAILMLALIPARIPCSAAENADPAQQLVRAQIDQLAVLVSALSEGRCGIMSGYGSAPKTGAGAFAARASALPPFTVFPATAPLGVNLPDISWAKVLGAVSLGVAASDPKGQGKIDPGVYLVVNPAVAIERIPSYAPNGPIEVHLLGLVVDDRGKVGLQDKLTVAGTVEPPGVLDFRGSGPGISAHFAPENPRQVVTELTWKEGEDFRVYRFALDLGIIYK